MLTFYSCANNSNSDAAFKMLSENLVRSNILIDRSTITAYKSLEDKLNDPATIYKAQVWYPKAKKVRQLSKDMIDRLEKLKNEVRGEKSLSRKRVIELYSQLLKYKDDLLNTDSSLRMEFGNAIMITERSFDLLKAKPNDFFKIFFDHLSAEAIVSILTKFQNNIKINENGMIRFCDFTIPDMVDFYETYSVMAVQNSSYVKRGDQIEITAGVGTFSLKAKPTITINGKNIHPETDGVAYYKFKASKNSGKHYIPVEVRFTDRHGKEQTISRQMEYTVME